MWQWFLANGDKFLGWASTTAAAGTAAGMWNSKVGIYVTFGLAALTSLHSTFLPEPTKGT